jgi:hypothetical protein
MGEEFTSPSTGKYQALLLGIPPPVPPPDRAAVRSPALQTYNLLYLPPPFPLPFPSFLIALMTMAKIWPAPD